MVYGKSESVIESVLNTQTKAEVALSHGSDDGEMIPLQLADFAQKRKNQNGDVT